MIFNGKMQVFPGNPACRPCNPDSLTCHYFFVRQNGDYREMPINALHVAAMGDDDIISDVGVVANNLDNTIEYAENGIVAGGKVNALVKLNFAGYGMYPPAKPGGHAQTL